MPRVAGQLRRDPRAVLRGSEQERAARNASRHDHHAPPPSRLVVPAPFEFGRHHSPLRSAPEAHIDIHLDIHHRCTDPNARQSDATVTADPYPDIPECLDRRRKKNRAVRRHSRLSTARLHPEWGAIDRGHCHFLTVRRSRRVEAIRKRPRI
jgi:hypothetical protein